MPSSNALDFNFLIANALNRRKQSRRIAGLLLVAVLALHIGLAWYLFIPPETEPTKQPVVMEVVMLSAPQAKPSATEPPPAPPVKKEPVQPLPVPTKPPVSVKKPVVIKKSAPKTPPPAVADFIPAAAVESAPPVVAPTPAAVAPPTLQAPTKPAAIREADSKTVVTGVVPLVIVKPIYPNRAASRHIEGWVKVEFTIQTDGSVDDAVVMQAEPEGFFEDAALSAISKWKFKEKLINGVAVPQRAAQLLQFKLDH